MATIPVLLAMALGLLLGAGLAYYLLRGQQQAREQAAIERERGLSAAALARAEAERDAAHAELQALQKASAEAQEAAILEQGRLRDLHRAESEAKLAAEAEVRRIRDLHEQERAALKGQLEQLREFEKTLKDKMEALTGQALERNRKLFLDQAMEQLASMQKEHQAELDKRKQAVETMVQPIRERLDGVQKAVQEFDKSSAERHAGLGEHLRQLGEAQRSLHGEAQNLTTALRGKPGLRGTWGEMQLRRAVELAGMQKHVDFDEQKQVMEGRERPDMTVKLPNGHSIAVDSKAVTESYMPVVQAEAETEREAAMKAFAAKVRSRVKELADRNYWAKLEQSPDFVVMFLPGESIFSTALEADPALMEFGVQNNVILATPLTLIALLRAVAYGWRQEQLAENAERISKLGQDLYDRVRKFAEHLQGVGKGLSTATDAYNQAVGSLEARVLPQTRKFKELGAGGKDELPELAALDTRPRELSAPELVGRQDGGGGI